MVKKEDKYQFQSCLTLPELKDYINGSLSEEDQADAKTHIDSCDMCKDAIDGMLNLGHRNELESKVIDIKKRVRKRTGLKYFNKGKTIHQNNFHQWTTLASLAIAIIIIVGAFYYIQFSWNEYSKQASEKYSIMYQTKEDLPSDSTYIPAHYQKGDDKFIKDVKEQFRKNGISFHEKNLVLHFIVTKDGKLDQIEISELHNPHYHQKIINILQSMPNWIPASINDQFINSEVEIIIPAI